MKIDELIEELIDLKSKGVETIQLLDENGYDYGIDFIQQSEDSSEVGFIEIYSN